MADASLEQAAREFCVRAHDGQTRDDGEPYSTHPIAVAQILRNHGVEDDVTLAAAYLHDVLEDTQVPRNELERLFGDEVAAIVEELTNRGYPGRTFEEKHRTLAEHALRMSSKAKAIKLADRLHNLSQMDVWTADRRRRYADATVQLLEALKPWPIPELGERIEKLIQEYL